MSQSVDLVVNQLAVSSADAVPTTPQVFAGILDATTNSLYVAFDDLRLLS